MNKFTISYEFFPPKTPEAKQALHEAIVQLKPTNPAYISVTYGAGGSTRESTHQLVQELKQELHIPVVAHLTCVASSREEIRVILRQYNEIGITDIMALRGDLPKGLTNPPMLQDGFEHAKDLVAFIKEIFPHFRVGVAGFPEGHPTTPNRLIEMNYLKEKIDAGADYICTQLFFDNNMYIDFVERCRINGIFVPIIPGLMPVTTRKGMERMAELSLGSRYPAKLLAQLTQADSDETIEKIGIAWCAEQVKALTEYGVPGLHFYTLNRAETILKILKKNDLYDK